jgi:hypothetical protein
MTGGAEVRRIGADDAIPVTVLRDFLLGALRHDAIHDVLFERMDFHAARRQLDADGLAAVLPELIGDVLAVASKEDWIALAEILIDSYDDAAGEEASG